MTKFILNLALVAAMAPVVLTAPCTSQQLGGFRFTSPPSGASYEAGTQQVASVDHPADSPISALNQFRIVGPTNAILSNTVVPFSGNVGVGIPVTLPQNLASGQYNYRAILAVSTGGTCELDSNRFSVTALTAQCTAGTSQCVSATEFRTCNANRQYNPVQTCQTPQSCTQTGTTATCSLGSATPCVFGTTRCVAGQNAFEYCEFVSGAGVATQYKTRVSCPSGTACTNNLYGQGFAGCTASQAVVCTAGQQRCAASGTAIETCQNNAWVVSQTCTGGQSCNLPAGSSTPVCSLTSGPGGVCVAGTSRCVGNSFQQCSVQDLNNQWTYGTLQACGTGTTCTLAFGGAYAVCA